MARSTKPYEPKELVTPISFTVWPRESDPHEYGPLVVVIDQGGLRFSWLGEASPVENPHWECSWTEMRDLLEMMRETDTLAGNLAHLREEIDDLRYQLGMQNTRREMMEKGQLVEFPIKPETKGA